MTSIDEKNYAFEQYFLISYPSDMDGLAMTCSDFPELSMAIPKNVVIDRWPTM